MPRPAPCQELAHFSALGVHWHWPDWLLLPAVVAACRCGAHRRIVTAEAVLQARAWPR